MSAGFLGFENGQWKWQCLDCGKTFLGKAGDAKGAIEIHEAAEHSAQRTELCSCTHDVYESIFRPGYHDACGKPLRR